VSSCLVETNTLFHASFPSGLWFVVRFVMLTISNCTPVITYLCKCKRELYTGHDLVLLDRGHSIMAQQSIVNANDKDCLAIRVLPPAYVDVLIWNAPDIFLVLIEKRGCKIRTKIPNEKQE
jgi:hypothetical protein